MFVLPCEMCVIIITIVKRKRYIRFLCEMMRKTNYEISPDLHLWLRTSMRKLQLKSLSR